MKLKLFSLLLLFWASQSFAQEHKNKCKLKVLSAEPVVWNDKLRWYKIVINNGNSKAVDACEWSASFYNKFGDLLGVKDGGWSSGKGDPVQPGQKIKDRESPDNIGDADNIVITIKKVHFFDGTVCE